MTNVRNFGNLTGRLARDPKVFKNDKNGAITDPSLISHKVAFTVMADRNYRDKDGNTPSDGIPVEAFIRAGVDPNSTPFANIHRGDLVQVETTLRDNTYTDGQGQTHYGFVVQVESITFLEPRSVTQGRLAQRVNAAEQENKASQAAAPAEQAQPAPAQETLPFGG